jgi:DNA uptake protein ComE-like DNA-binding protein
LHPQWINVDTETDRLAELHSKSNAQAQEQEAMKVVRAVERSESSTQTGGAAIMLRSKEDEDREGTAFELWSEVLHRNASELQRMLQQDGAEWAQREAERRFKQEEGARQGQENEEQIQQWRSMPAAAAAVESLGPHSPAPSLPSKSYSAFPLGGAAGASVVSPSDADVASLLTVSAVSLNFPLYDTLTHQRLVVPVRGSCCIHPEAFDLWSHIQHRLEVSDKEPVWVCPCCKKEAWAPDLRVDPLLFHVLTIIQEQEKAKKNEMNHNNQDEEGKQAEAGDAKKTPAISQDATQTDNGAVTETAVQDFDRSAAGTFAAASSPPPVSASSSPAMLVPAFAGISLFRFGPSSPLLSVSSFSHSVSRLSSLSASHVPSSSECFEERRLTVRVRDHGLLDLSVSSEAEDEAKRMKNIRTRRAATICTIGSSGTKKRVLNQMFEAQVAAPPSSTIPHSNPPAATPKSESGAPMEIDGAPTAAAPGSTSQTEEDVAPSPLKRIRTAAAVQEFAGTATAMLEDPVDSSDAASLSRPSTPLAWPTWTDSDGNCWIDVRGGPDAAPPALWEKIRVKTENAHREYEELQARNREMFFAPPPLPTMNTQPSFPIAAPLNGHPWAALVNPAAALAAAGNYAAGAPSFGRASTLPAASPYPPGPLLSRFTSAQGPVSAASPAKKKAKKKKKKRSASGEANEAEGEEDDQEEKGGAFAAPTGLASPAVQPPRLNLNRCSQNALLQLEGIGKKMAERLMFAREQKWLLKKVEYNEQKRAEWQLRQAAALHPAASAAPASLFCECADPQWCTHVRAFEKMSSLKKVEGIGEKMMDKLRQHCTVE